MMVARRRGLWLVVVAALLFAFGGSADAKKKKKKTTHHKTPSGKTAAPEPEEEESDTGAGKKEEPEEESKPPAAKTPAPAETGEGEKPPGEEAPAPKKKKVVVEAEPESAIVSGAPSALEFFAGAGALFRNLAFNQNQSPDLVKPYSLTPGPQAMVALEAYPGAFFTSGFGANIGAFVRFNYGFAVTSKQPDGTTLTTAFDDFLLGFKVRLRFGMVDPFVSIGYGDQAFRFSGQSTILVPSVNYTFIHAGLGVRLHLAPIVDLDLSGAYLALNGLGTAAGDIASSTFFPNAAGYAAEGNLSIRLRLTRLIALRAGGDFRQYGLTLHAASGAQPYVGGAADRYIVGYGGIELVFDGVGGGAAAEEEKPAPPPPSKKAKPRRQPEPDLSDDAAE
jgi:hypothetical protein